MGLKQMPTAPQPAPIDINLPPSVPELPDDVKERFPSLADWEESMQQWYANLSTVLNDIITQSSGVTNQNTSQLQTVESEVATALQPGPFTAGALAPAGSVEMPDSSGTTRKFLTG